MRPEPRQFEAIVLGAGAAGLMCAATAGQRGRRVALLEHGGQAGRKILISGGGRCNFTNLHCGPENFISENKHFAKSALAGFRPGDFVALVERYGIAWHEKTLGQLFCDGSSRASLDMLLAECALGGVELVLNARSAAVKGLGGGGFRVSCSAGEFEARSVVVATGGLSIPKMGARWTELAGVSAEVVAWVEPSQGRSSDRKAPKYQPVPFREKMLVTHRGLSGPAVLQASSYWRAGEALVLDLAPGSLLDPLTRIGVVGALMQPRARRDTAALRLAMREILPQRLASFLAESGGQAGWGNAALMAWEQKLHCWRLHPVGTEGFEKAEVTAGGVDTAGLQARTLEARAVPGLYFIGEAVDVTGWLGGFNFQWAWASAVAAGKAC
jgi:predicted flavoprotein YhiN